jgi:hypothetical protein
VFRWLFPCKRYKSTFPHYELISYLRSDLLTDIANALRVPVWDIAAFAKVLLGA